MIKWTKTHTELQALLKKEIEAMRQLLGNMHQEEVFIVQKDKTYLPQLMNERAKLIAQLTSLRLDRVAATERLESLENHTNSNLEDLLPPNDENSCDILILRDQMLALLDRIHLQSSRNEMLSHLEAYQPAPQKKGKISVATLPPDDYNSTE